MKRFVIGDIHSMNNLLSEVIEKSGIDYKNDLLIQIGDIVDRGPDPFGCMDELLKFKNLILIKGNHDQAFVSKVTTDQSVFGNHDNGQYITKYMWDQLSKGQKQYYTTNIFDKQIDYHITGDNIMFVHGGFPLDEKLEEISSLVFYWDREMVEQSMKCKEGEKLPTLYNFKDIFIGHTPTIYFDTNQPIISGGVINIDTGAGKGGPLTIMDIDSKQFWQAFPKR